MATAPTYITHKELKRIFPQLDEFDGKTPVYGWESGYLNFTSTSLDLYFSHDSGLVNTLFWSGSEIDKIPYSTTAKTQVKTAVTPDATSIDVDSTTGLGVDDIIKINNEYMKITAITDGDTLAVSTPSTNRGLFKSSAQHHAVDDSVYLIIDKSADVGDPNSAGLDALSFVYDTDLDLCILITNDANPSDFLIESGEDFTTLVSQYRSDASRYFDSRVDPSLPREQLKDKSGNYDYMVVRSVGLIAACFMMKTKDHSSPIAQSFMEEAERNIELLNEGKAALSWQNTSDASQGLIRDITYTSGKIRPVDTRGNYSGTWDLIKVKIGTGGVLGTATYNVYTKDGDSLKSNQVVTEEIINGDFQTVAGGLQIRFAGDTDTTQAAANDEWEIEVTGRQEYVDSSDMKSIKLTRTGTPARRYYK